jgi:carboxyl-terminal processing protease
MTRLLTALLLSLAAQAQQLETFDAVWKTIADKHWNPKHLESLPGGGSWESLREPYRQRVQSAANQSEVRAILREMIAKIGKSHYAIAGLEMKGASAMRQGGGTSPGFRVGLVEGKVVVTGLNPKFTQVALGWELKAVDGTPILTTIEAAETLQTGLRLHQMLQNQISGFAGETLTYDFAMTGGVKKKVTKDVGYFRLDMFLDVVRVLPQFEQAIAACAKCKGFIIDLRGNPGGVAVMANAMAGWFVKDAGVKLGTMYQRGVDLNFAVIPRLNGFAGPLAVLVDSASASTSEILAGGLQDLKRARIFGSRTAGAALPSVIETLPNGDLFQFAVANYVSESGRELEGIGVKPDSEVAHTLAALRAQRDRPIEAAINWVYANPAVALRR